MVVQGYLLSFLVRKFFLQRDSATLRGVPGWWVWEPGSWRAASHDEKTQGFGGTVSGKSTTGPQRGDALCYALRVTADRAYRLRVGRAESSDLVINDETVSREHLILHFDTARGFEAESIGAARTADEQGVLWTPGQRVPLQPGMRTQLGAVRFTFFDSAGFLARLDDEVQKQLHPQG